MRRIVNTLDSFLYEISAYIVPGFLLVATVRVLVCTDHGSIDWSCKGLTDWGLTGFGIFEWLIILIASYIAGMLIAGLVFRILAIPHRPMILFNHHYGIYRILRNEKPAPSLYDIRGKILGNIITQFDLNHDMNDDHFLKGIRNIGQLISLYLEETSNVEKPSARYYQRLSLAQNLAFVITIISLMQLFIAANDSIFLRLLFMLICIFIAIVMMLYVRTQSLWMAEMNLRRFYIISRTQVDKKE